MSRKTFDSVSKMVDAIAGGDAFADSVKKRIVQRQVVKSLFAMRSAKGIPQSKIAKVLGCSQSRVSKIESGFDGDLSLQELEAYARALGADVHLVFLKRGSTAVERVKMHAFAIKRELDRLAECAHKDEKIAEAVAAFIGEAFFNLVRLVHNSSRKLPNRSDEEPYIQIGMTIDELDCAPRVASDCPDESEIEESREESALRSVQATT
jgi:transcriptional regulator with XRE-family HTH domain